MTQRIERRKHARVMPKGTVMVDVGEQQQRGRIANISAGGMLATTSVTAPERMLARVTQIDLRLDDRDASWLKLSGKIMRITADSIAMAFETVPADFQSALDQVGNAAHLDRRRLSVVLVDAVESRRSAIAAGFRENGCAVLEASTALETIVRLGEARFEPNLIAIADSLPAQVSDELRTFVEREHPEAKLVTIGDSATNPGDILNWLSSSDPDSDLAARVRRVLSSQLRGK
jgi:hypothetical protein